jgi:hypothetical protein
MVDLRKTPSPLCMNDFGSAAQARENDLVVVGDAFAGNR